MNNDRELQSVEQYNFEPIKGYPMLNWKGKRPYTSTQYYPAQLKESYGEPDEKGWRNKVFWGDNLQVMSHLLKEYRGKVDLVYIDPPFDSKADYKKMISLKGKSVNNDHSMFEEIQYGDMWNNDDYLQFMYERLVLIRELLSENGSLYVHCDGRKSHHLRMILDEIFGETNFRNEIRWKRQPVRGAKARAKQYAKNSDTILFYSKSSIWTWNGAYKPYDENFIKTKFREDENGRLFRDCDLGDYSEDSIKKFEAENKIYITSGGKKRLKRFLDEERGESLGDMWIDIPELNSQAMERENYPTQKPEALLTRIINASSQEGDLIFDCFAGSGTTLATALKLNRRFIGADINLGAIQTTSKRLISSFKNNNNVIGFEVFNVNNYEIFRNPVQAKQLLIEALEIQKLENAKIYDGEKDGFMVKIMPVNRIATKADLNDIIANLDYRTYEERQKEYPNQPVEHILLVCMGHEADLAASLEKEIPYKVKVEVVDILRDRANLEFKRESEALITIENSQLIIKNFYPMNLLQKLSIMKENVTEWKELVESVMIDWNYDGAILEPTVVDIPTKNEFVIGIYDIPKDAGTIRVKITDLLSESLEVNIDNE